MSAEKFIRVTNRQDSKQYLVKASTIYLVREDPRKGATIILTDQEQWMEVYEAITKIEQQLKQ